jgi:hypothetical protein
MAGPQVQQQPVQEQPVSQPQPHVQTQVQYIPNVTAPASHQTISLTAANETHYPAEAMSITGYPHHQALAYTQQTSQELAPTYDRYVPIFDPRAQSTVQSWLNHPHLQVLQPPLQKNYASQEYVYPTSVPQTQTYPTLRPHTAMHGYADDYSLQEHWTSFMCNVGSPRQFMTD